MKRYAIQAICVVIATKLLINGMWALLLLCYIQYGPWSCGYFMIRLMLARLRQSMDDQRRSKSEWLCVINWIWKQRYMRSSLQGLRIFSQTKHQLRHLSLFYTHVHIWENQPVQPAGHISHTNAGYPTRVVRWETSKLPLCYSDRL